MENHQIMDTPEFGSMSLLAELIELVPDDCIVF